MRKSCSRRFRNSLFPELPLKAFDFIDDRLTVGRACYMLTPVKVWVNNQNQNLNVRMYIFNDAVHFVGSGHFSYGFNNILNVELAPSWDMITLTIRGRSKGVRVRSDTIFISYQILKKLL